MSCNFSANQFDKEFAPTKLGNWEVPKWFPTRPVQRKGHSKIIANDSGHLLPGVPRPTTNPWGHFKGTWQLPDKISRYQAHIVSKPPRGGSRWNKPINEKDKTIVLHSHVEPEPETVKKEDKGKQLDLSYTPGDFTESIYQHPSRQLLLKQKADKQIERENRYKQIHPQSKNIDLVESQPKVCEPVESQNDFVLPELADNEKSDSEKMQKDITLKPTERDPTYSILIPAYCNFAVAKKMAQENLEHQPLPDTVMDKAYRKSLAMGAENPGLSLDMLPRVTGVGIKPYKAGATHCTKMRVYRPKTAGIVPKPLDKYNISDRPQSSMVIKEKMQPMDLAICWDYRPMNPADEPKRPVHVDGSNGSVAPAVFTLVKTPRDDKPLQSGRSAGVFANTLGEENFFEKDILRKKLNFNGKPEKSRPCTCGNFSRSTLKLNACEENQLKYSKPRQMSAQSEPILRHGFSKSSPNLSTVVNPSCNGSLIDQQLVVCSYEPTHHHLHLHRDGEKIIAKCKHHKHERPKRLCEVSQSNEPIKKEIKESYKCAFKAGKPQSSSSTCTSSDSGFTISTCSDNTCKSIRIPKPRNPYSKKNYVIDTLHPPFACWKGGAGQGGYPEHWRLASVYQHAYKPIEQRKRALLDTVYQ